MEGVVHPGENELRSRIGGDCLSVRLPPTLSLPCWQRICWSRRCQSLSSAVCPCQVLPLYTGLRSQHWILCHCFPHYKCCHLHHCSLWTFLWWSGGAAAVLRSKRLEWSQDRSRAEGCFRVIEWWYSYNIENILCRSRFFENIDVVRQAFGVWGSWGTAQWAVAKTVLVADIYICEYWLDWFWYNMIILVVWIYLSFAVADYYINVGWYWFFHVTEQTFWKFAIRCYITFLKAMTWFNEMKASVKV